MWLSIAGTISGFDDLVKGDCRCNLVLMIMTKAVTLTRIAKHTLKYNHICINDIHATRLCSIITQPSYVVFHLKEKVIKCLEIILKKPAHHVS